MAMECGGQSSVFVLIRPYAEHCKWLWTLHKGKILKTEGYPEESHQDDQGTGRKKKQ